MIADDMAKFIKSDVVTYGSISFLLIASLWLFFGQARFIVIPIIVCVVSVICASGLFNFIGFEVTVISSNYIALQLIMTMSLVIHLTLSYREFYLRYPHFTQRQLVFIALKDRFNPCFFGIATTILDFYH